MENIGWYVSYLQNGVVRHFWFKSFIEAYEALQMVRGNSCTVGAVSKVPIPKLVGGK